MTSPPVRSDEPRRLEALRRYGILDTDPEPAFDDLTYLASAICQTPIAAITLVDERRQWFKSIVGLPVRETERDLSFCAHAVFTGDLLVVPDTLSDPRFASNPLVTSEPKVRFYAGAPLVTGDGYPLGTICVVDQVPRLLPDASLRCLEALARQALAQLELRRQLSRRTTSLADTLSDRDRKAAELRERDALVHLLIEQLPGVVWTVDRELVITSSIGAALSGMGILPNQLVGTPLTEFLGNADPTFLPVAAHQRALAGESVSYGREAVGRAWDTHIEPLVDGEGAVVGAIGIALDVTDRKRAEEELRASEERFRTVVETAADGVVTVDADAHVLFANPAAERILGYEPGMLAGQPLRDLLPESARADFEAARRRYLEARAQGKPWPALEVTGLRRNGSEVPLEISVSESARQDVKTFTAIVRDVSERKVADNLRSALFRVAETTRGSEELPKLFGAVHRIVRKLMDATSFLVALKDPSTGRLEFRYFADEKASAPPSPNGKTLTEWVLRTGESLLATPEKLRQLAEAGEIEPPPRGLTDWVGAPLRSGDRTIGVLAAAGYSEKPRFSGADREVLAFVASHVASTIEKRQAQEALTVWKNRYEAATLASRQVLYDHDVLRDATTWGGDTERVLGMSPRDIPSTIVGWTELLHPDDRAAFELECARVPQGEETYHLEYRVRRPDGSYIHVRDHGTASADENGNYCRNVGFIVDITDRKSLEEQLRQSQKMEAVGRLAGGVAHDFNNVLTAILGYSDLLLGQVDDPEMRQNVEEIRHAGERAASLTSQLLAFSRKQILAPRVLDLNALVSNMHKMLRRVIGEDVELQTKLSPVLGRVKADPGQIEHVIMNLAVNARDAMPQGGTLTIETGEAELPVSSTEPGGRQIVLSVTDTGLGMDAETRARVFEPFFTTKALGKGTGLGLATSYGIVKQSGGEILVESRPGGGTTIRLFLPRVEALSDHTPTGPFAAIKLGGNETVLVVEDEKAVGSLAKKVLESNGYHVLEARGADEALRASQAHEGPVHLLLTDVVMPGLSGRELAHKLRALRPDIKVLYMSGYTDDAMVRHGLRDTGTYFLQKPFSLERLLAQVRETLDRRPKTPSQF